MLSYLTLLLHYKTSHSSNNNVSCISKLLYYNNFSVSAFNSFINKRNHSLSILKHTTIQSIQSNKMEFEAMEFFRSGNTGKSVIVIMALASILLPSSSNAMPAPRKFYCFLKMIIFTWFLTFIYLFIHISCLIQSICFYIHKRHQKLRQNQFRKYLSFDTSSQ